MPEVCVVLDESRFPDPSPAGLVGDLVQLARNTGSAAGAIWLTACRSAATVADG
ncbi:hypothetical protein [Streptomyces sp. NPDC096153]|uniref:hypothetical protein n=1 Tax=Streptomyces sp. NPDC096153 TaxID=3155548 RepID=UPI003324C907